MQRREGFVVFQWGDNIQHARHQLLSVVHAEGVHRLKAIRRHENHHLETRATVRGWSSPIRHGVKFYSLGRREGLLWLMFRRFSFCGSAQA